MGSLLLVKNETDKNKASGTTCSFAFRSFEIKPLICFRENNSEIVDVHCTCHHEDDAEQNDEPVQKFLGGPKYSILSDNTILFRKTLLKAQNDYIF